MRNRWLRYLGWEINIKYKSSFFSRSHIFYCACYYIIRQTYYISLLQLAEIIFLAWVIGHLQIYVFDNFDETDELTGKWWLGALVCSIINMIAAYFMNWFDGSLVFLFGFGLYQVFFYLGLLLSNKIKRHVDSKQLNQQLNQFKKKKGVKS